MFHFGLGVVAGYAFRGLIGKFLAKYGPGIMVKLAPYILKVRMFFGF